MSDAVQKKVEDFLDNQLPDFLDQLATAPVSTASVVGLDQQKLDTLYAAGVEQYEKGRLEEAFNIFGFLCRVDQLDGRNFMALGAVFQKQNKLEKAVEAYSFASILNMEDPEPSFHGAQCLVLLGEKDRAKQALEATVMQAENSEEHAEILRMARLMKEQLQGKTLGAEAEKKDD